MVPVHITPKAVLLFYLLSLVCALLGSFLSIRRVNKVDPAIVFKA